MEREGSKGTHYLFAALYLNVALPRTDSVGEGAVVVFLVDSREEDQVRYSGHCYDNEDMGRHDLCVRCITHFLPCLQF